MFIPYKVLQVLLLQGESHVQPLPDDSRNPKFRTPAFLPPTVPEVQQCRVKERRYFIEIFY